MLETLGKPIQFHDHDDDDEGFETTSLESTEFTDTTEGSEEYSKTRLQGITTIVTV